MVESYAVSTRLEVVDLLNAALTENAKKAAALAEALKKATSGGTEAFRKLATAGTQAFTRLGDIAARLDKSLAGLGDEAAVTAGKVKAAGASMATAFDPSIRQVARLQAAIEKVNRTPIRAGSGGAGGAGGGGGGGGGGPSRRGGGHGGGDMLMTGLFMSMFGDAMAEGLKSPVMQASDLQNQRMALQRQLGSSPTAGADYTAANTAAAALSRAMPNVPLSSALKSLGDLYSVLGSMPEAVKFLQPMESYSTVMNALTPNKQVDAYTAMRATEMLGQSTNAKTGAIDPTRANQFLNVMEAAAVSTQGRVNEQSWLGFAQQAGLAGKNLTPDGMRMMVPIINEMGGQRAGTALSSMSNQLLGGVMPQRIVDDWKALHLIDMSKVTATRTGVRVGAGAIANSDPFASNPVAWVEATLLPAMQKAGMSKTQEITEIMRLFSRTTSQREAGIMATQLVQIQKDFKQQLQAMPTQQSMQQLQNMNFSQNVVDLTGAWSTLMQQLGTTVLPTLVPLMQSLTKTIQALTKDVVAHPTVAKDLLLLAGGIAGLAIPIGGAITAISALRFALVGFSGMGAGNVATVAGESALARLLPLAGPIGGAIGAGFLAYLGLKGLDSLITGSAPPNRAPPRTGYHPNGLGGTLPGAPAAGSPEATWLGNLWRDATTGTGGRTVNGQPITLPGPAAAPATGPAVTPDAATQRQIDRQGDRDLTAAVAQGVREGMAGATLAMDGNKVATIVMSKIVTARKAVMQRGRPSPSRAIPSMPSQAVGNR